MADKKTILSGVKPSGGFHIGNYVGAIKQWLDIQMDYSGNELFFMIADLHAITVPQKPKELRANILDLTAWYIASGLDPEKSTIFLQSENPDHASLAWILDCITPMGWMERMIQYKEKSHKEGERASVGLFHYPSLMSADILLYDTQLVPVGEDQTQHVELARDVAKKFNKTFGELFVLPKAIIKEESARIMSLQNPEVKMSKSENDLKGTIYLSDDEETIRAKIRKAVTDSGISITYDPQKRPAISNLMNVYSALSHESIQKISDKYKSKTYVDFKEDLAEVVVQKLAPLQKRHYELMSDKSYLHSILDEGSQKAREISSKKLKAVQKAVGFLREFS